VERKSTVVGVTAVKSLEKRPGVVPRQGVIRYFGLPVPTEKGPKGVDVVCLSITCHPLQLVLMNHDQCRPRRKPWVFVYAILGKI
jgi:hypothetical protein